MIASRQDPRKLESEVGSDKTSEILEGVVAASNDACWCMEFGEPVDLTAPDREIIRQVFENDPFWRFTNPAMSRLYLLNAEVDFNSRPTSEIFPRNRQNEAFIRNLIENGFEVDAAPALDTRYDGVQIYVENDVRAHIENGRLLRIFGIVRDVGKHRLRVERMQAELNEALEILTALPCGVIAFDAGMDIVAANPTASTLLGCSVDDLIGGCMKQENQYEAVLDAVAAVATNGRPANVAFDGLVWMISPRPGSGVVATLYSETSRARRL